MKTNIKIRQSIFETNSSSSHSFSMGPEGRFTAKLDMDKDGVIKVSSCSWTSCEKSNNPEIKLSYLLSFAWTITGDSDEWVKIRDVIYQVVMDFTGAKNIEFTPEENVDHQSTDIIDRRDLVNPDFVREFVFNENTWIYLLWDSETPEKDFFEKSELSENLYQISFNLPGIDPEKTKLTISYREAYNINSEIYHFLDQFVYCPEKKIFKETSKDLPGTYTYKGSFKYGGNNNEEFIIDLPKIDLCIL